MKNLQFNQNTTVYNHTILSFGFSKLIENIITTLFILLFVAFSTPTFAQHCGGAPTTLAKWDFNSENIECNGAENLGPTPITNPSITPGATYCPNVNNGCGRTVLGSVGHQNTPQYQNAVCLANFYAVEAVLASGKGAPYDPDATTFDPEGKANLSVWYDLEKNTEGCLSSFSLKVLQKQYDGSTVNFETQGVAVKRNGVIVYNTSVPISAANVNGTPIDFTFSGDEFCSDGSELVEFEIIFGLVHRLNGPALPGQPGQTGYDDICLNGYCKTNAFGGIIPASCGAAGPNDDAEVLIQNFELGNTYDFNEGDTYTGSATFATGTPIPEDGSISDFANPIDPIDYTFRVFQENCFADFTVTLNPQYCCIVPDGNVVAIAATCNGSTANDDAQITVTDVVGGTRTGISMGNTYSGPAFASADLLVGGEFTFTALPNPLVAQIYTIRVFESATCFIDYNTSVYNESCVVPCTPPNGVELESTMATCSGDTKNTDATISVTNVNGGDRVGMSPSITYSGPDYAGASDLVNGSYTFTGINTPAGAQIYTIRVYNTSDGCYIDQTVEIEDPQCGDCVNLGAFVTETGPNTLESDGSNNQSAFESCDDGGFIDLELTKDVAPSTGLTCGATGTPFVWTLTITNEGNMTATNVNVIDLIPEGLSVTATNPSKGTFFGGSGWAVGSLDASETATLEITTIALLTGTYNNCAYVNNAMPEADLDSSIDNTEIANEDDDDCASITVTGDNPPIVEKFISPRFVLPNVPSRLTFKITNNNDVPITMTSDLVDDFPSIPEQMVVATVPNLYASSGVVPGGSGIVATAGGTSITIPSGTVFQSGLNQITVDITVPLLGNYCNTIEAGEFITDLGTNCLATETCIKANPVFEMPPIVTKRMDPENIAPGEISNLIITIENMNGSPMTLNQDFIDPFPSGLVLDGSLSSTCNTATLENGNTEVKLASGSVIAGNSSCVLTIPLRADDEGTYCNVINMNQVLTEVGDNIENGNDEVAEFCLIVAEPEVFDLALTKTINTSATPGPFSPDSMVQFTITVFNQGNIDAYDIDVADYFNAAELSTPTLVAQSGVVDNGGGTFTIDQIAAGSNVSFDIISIIDAGYLGTNIINNAEITGGSSEDNGPDALDEDSTPNNNSASEPETDNDDVVTDNDSGETVDDDVFEDDFDPAEVPVVQPCTDPELTPLSDETICLGGSFTPSNVTTSVTNSISVNYQWYNNDGPNNPGLDAIAGQTSAGLTDLPMTVGSYSFLVEAISTANGNCIATETVNLTVGALPTTTLNNPILCTGESAMVVATVLDGQPTYSYVWSVPGGGSDPGNVPSFATDVAGMYSVTVTDGNGCVSSTSTNVIEDSCLSDPCEPGELGGMVYRDFDGNGINNLEPGVEDVRVMIYGSDVNGSDILIETVFTDSNGEYSFSSTDITFDADEKYRIEFSDWPECYMPSLKGNSNGGSTIVACSLSCENHFALVDTDTYCQTNPYLITSCYVEGDQGATSAEVLVGWRHDVVPEANENDDINNINYEALSGQIGTTFGLAYHKRSNRIFAAAHMKRFAGFAPGSNPSTIFVVNNPSDNVANGSAFLSLDEYFGSGTAGTDIHDFSSVDVNPSPGVTQMEVLDPAAFDAVGKYALGDIDFNTKQDTLYAINLFNRSLYAIPIGSDPENPVKPANASEIEVISLVGTSTFNQITATVGNDELRPFALKYYEGKLYVGMVGSAQSGGDLVALVFAFNPADDSLTKVLETSLIYSRGCAFGINNGTVSICAGPADWNPWVASWPQNTGGGIQDAASVNINFINPTTILALEEGHPQPMLTDIEFDLEGNMILALRDRVGDQGGTNAPYPGGEQVRLPNGNYVFTNNAGNYQNSPDPTPPPGFVGLYFTNQDAFGDLLLATKTGSTYTVNLSDFTDNTMTLPNSQMTFDNCVPGESVFNGDCYNDGLFVHEETSMGGLALLYYQGTLIAPAMDPRANAFSNGIDWFDMKNGTNKIKSTTILTGANSNSPFGKAYGLGEMELLCALPPIEVGDYVWADVNADGVQNPNEIGIEGVTVNIYDADKNIVGTTTTDSSGYYLFDDSNTNPDLEPETDYFITFGEGQFDSSSGILSLSATEMYALTVDSTGVGSSPNNNDSDAEPMAGMFGGAPVTPITSPEFGADHTFDAGFIPKPIVTITDVDVACGSVDGGSISVSVSGGVEPYTYDWDEDAYDGMTDIINVPIGVYNLTVTDGIGCEITASTEITEEPCPPDPCVDGELGGTVFDDINANGQDDGDVENSVQGIQVQLFICDADGNNVLVETVSTDSNGDYHFSDPSIDLDNNVYQIVFSNLPDGYISSSIGSDNNSDVQYTTDLGCDYDYGILHPDQVCASPNLEESVVVGNELFSNGKLLGPGIAMLTCGTIVDLAAEEQHTVGLMDIKGITTAADRPEVNPNGWYHPSWHVDTIGNVFGIDYDTTGNIYVTASSHYSHVFGYVLGPDASNYTQAIIKYGNLGGGDNDLNAAGTVYKLDAVTGQASVFAQLPQQAFAFNHYACEATDPPLPRTTGPGLGNVVYDQVNNQFFVSNFEDGMIYRLDVDGNTLSTFDPQTLGVFSADDNSAGWAPDAKPYGLAVNADGSELYFGTHELNTAPGLYSVSLDTDGNFDGSETFHAIYPAEGDIGYLFAVEPGWVAISDLEFLPNGNIMVGLRTGCAGQYATSHNHGATFYIADAEGDGLFDNIVSNPDIQYPNDGTNNDDGYGGIGIWDKKDGTYDFLVTSSDTRFEEGPHGMILFPHNFTNGNAGFPLQPSAAIPYLPSFNVQDFKGVGGDVEIFSPCGDAPIHVGNYAWIDANGNGVQDACESPMSNLTVKLYTKPASGNPVLVATTQTDGDGEYYFTDSSSVTENWEASFAAIEKDSSYYIVFCGDSYNPDGEVISVGGILFSSTIEDVDTTAGGDLTDSDITNTSLDGIGEFLAICITASETNYSFDAGFIPKPDVALIQVLDPDYDTSELAFGDSVKFKIVVYNQSLLAVDSLEVTDFIPNGFAFDPMLTGNEAWSIDGDNATTILSDGLAPEAKDSICIYLTLLPNENPYEWVNIVEISNAWSNGTPIEDCDSELNDNPDDNGGSEIDTEADDEIFGNGTATEPGGDPETDQDNVDPATVPICDLALINKIAEAPSTLKLGDTIKYEIIIENQGTEPATNIEIDYTIPNGLTYLDLNNDLVPNWSEGTGDANATVVDELGIGEKDTLCIYLELTNAPADPMSNENWTTFAEIASFEDPSDPGTDKSDIDSTPNGDPTDDSGGNPDDDTDDVTTGDGTGDADDPVEDTDPLLDEDDHDPAIIYVCDAAAIIYTDNSEPILYGDTIKFNVVVFNQGNGPITNVDLNDFLGSGLEFVSTAVNDAEGWSGDNDLVSATVTDVINPGESDTTCLELIVVDVIPYDEDAYLQIVEIAEFEDPDAPGIPKTDIDSSPDSNPEDDSGGNPEDATDDEVDGNGTGDPENPSEDSDPELDEDDNDPVLIYIFDLALDKVVQEDKVYSPGEKPIFEITVYNQGNVTANNFKIVDYLRDGFTFSTLNNTGWDEEGDNLVYTSTSPLEPGEFVTITLELTVVIPMTPMGVSDWWNYAEIREADDNSNDSDPDPTDADSNPNDTETDDNMVVPDSEDDDVITENGLDGGDEDDHDPAKVIVGYDLALRKTVSPEGPYSYGDTLAYTITIFNQGGLSVSDIAIYDSIPCGFLYLEDLNDWDLNGDIASTTLEDVLGPGAMTTKNIMLLVQRCDEPAYDNYLNIAEISDFADENGDEPMTDDIDSTPDSNPNNDEDPVDDAVEDSMEEDDHDIEDIEICDLALINTILDANDPPFAGDTIKYGVIVTNQGNNDANSVSINYLIPNGFTYLEVNDSLDEPWDLTTPVLAEVTTDEVLMPGESDTVCIYLVLENLPTDEVTIDSWTTLAEISEYTNQDDETKTTDADSKPDDDFTNDPGGNPDDDTDDEVDGDGSGDPDDPVEDGDPDLDEDDHDPVKIDVCDAAIFVEKDDLGPFKYNDVIKYLIIVHNQGNGDITNINIENVYQEGLSYIDAPINSNLGWNLISEGNLNLMMTDIIKPGSQDTVCLYLNIVPDHISAEDSWLDAVKVMSFESPDNIGVPLKDVDNPPMAPPIENDLEDDEETKVFDLALIMQIDSMPPVLPVVPGDILKFIVVVTNQGNTSANDVDITNYLMDDNLALADVKENDDWEFIDSENNLYTIAEEIMPGEKDTVCIYLEVQGGAMTDIVTYSEISGSTETDGDCYDIDSTPDDLLEGDPGGTPESPEDDHIEDDGVDGNEDGITDEDDHDPAKLDAQDLALIIWADHKEPVQEGDDVKFIIRVTNQGNITNENIRIVNYLPEGFELSENDDNGWEYDEDEEDQVFLVIEGPLEMDSIIETCILLTVQEGVDAEDLINYAEIVSSTGPDDLDLTEFDIDSYPNNIDDDDTGGQYEDMPDCSTDPIVINDDNYDEGAGVNGEDEDDHDPAWVHVFDLATIIYTDHTTPIIPGDEIKFNVEVHNQGNMSATDIDLLIYMPDGFALSENDDNDWDIQDGVLMGTYYDDLIPEEVDTVCLLLEVLPDFMLDDLIPVVEIMGAMDTLGNIRDESDLDSDPNDSVEDDEGGEIFTEDDDSVDGNGEVDDDEDDHDPAVPPVLDLAIKIITVDEEPKVPGDIVKFSIMVYNQGSMIPSEFTIENYVPEGLIFLNNSDNDGWQPAGATNATYVYDDELLPLTSDTLCIYLEVAPDANPQNVVDMVEIIQIIDQMDNDVSLLDIDSESDNSNENDLGNDLYSLEDNKIEENGRSGEDEDDHDQAFVNMCQSISCNGHMNISVDENCEAVITPSVVLTGDIFPDHVYEVEITNSDGEIVSNMFTGDDIGELFTVSVSNPLCDDISCWMTVLIEDKWAPQIICQNDTLSCAVAYDDSSSPTLIDDNCSGGELILLDEVVEPFSCDSTYTSKITRVWVAKDEAGNMSDECTQEILLLRTNLDSIMPVMNFMLATNNAISCSSGYETDAYGHPAPSLTGVPKLRLEDGSFIDLYPFDDMLICNGFVEYNDEVLPGSSSCVTKILRTWIVGEWWCSETIDREFIQVIEIVDFEGPEVTCPADFTISTSSFSCEGYTAFDLPVVSDACNGSNIRIDLSAPTSSEGFIKDYNGTIIDLPVGVNELTYHVYDDCDNRTDCTFRVTVRDDADPIAICDQFTAVGFGLEDLTKVSAEDIDDGSFDECGPVELAVARMDAPGFDDLIGFGPDVDITCEDVGTVVMVGLLVTDAGGNTNMCMVSIEVQDKIDAQMLCPGNIVVECNFPYDPDNLGAFFGEVEVYDNCPESNTVDDRLIGELNSCGSGVLTREIRLLNAQGDQVDFCTQQITFESGDPLTYSDITPPPSEHTVTGCGIESIDPSILGMPIVPDRECQQASIGIENDTFPFTQNGACLKIIRTFKVIDWCIDDGPGSIYEPFEFTQTIKVNNTEGPAIEVFADTVFCSFEVDCGAININDYLLATSVDDCTATDDLLNSFEVRDSDGDVVNSGSGLDASGLYGVDIYTVRFVSEDKCGNQEFEESTFEVRSCKLPTPYCLQGLSTTLTAMDTTGDGTADVEMVMLPASFFDAGSYHPCGYDVQVSYSEDVNDTLRSFFCSDTLDLQPIELWVTDSNGGQDYCLTFVDVQDNDTIDLCGGLKPMDITGRIYTESDAEVKDVAVELRSLEILNTMTDVNGQYEFLDMPEGGDYQVLPHKDNDHLNGVSTLDLVMIQRHILGLSTLESAYKLVAADINNNEKISSSDLLALRKVILGIEIGFINNTSWRFIDSEYEFANQSNPWEKEIDEVYNISGLSEDMQIDFIAVKTGDVDGNVDVNAGIISETRSAKVLNLELPDIEVEKGKLYELEVRGDQTHNVYGMQFSLMSEGIELIDVKSGMMKMGREHAAMVDGQLHVSYGAPNGDEVTQDEVLFIMIVQALEDGRLSEMIEMSTSGLNAESYHGEDLAIGDIGLTWREDQASLVNHLMLEGNDPNPWTNSTDIKFYMPDDGKVSMKITDMSGRLIFSKDENFKSGEQRIAVTQDDISHSGVMLYELKYHDQIVRGKMIRIN